MWMSQKIIHFELENDEVYIDYGLNWQLLLMDILINFFELKVEDGLNSATFCAVGDHVGFERSLQLFDLLNIPVHEYNQKFEHMEAWRIEMAAALEIQIKNN